MQVHIGTLVLRLDVPVLRFGPLVLRLKVAVLRFGRVDRQPSAVDDRQ
ncbi:MAG TPA: hypothetical protein VGF84_13825 [Micromonosporaceae bacterium]